MLHKTFISLGTNQGNRLFNLQKAINILNKEVGNLIFCSRVYETSSWGFVSDDFLNCCVELTTSLSPYLLLKEFKRIESVLGRQSKTIAGYEARVIDIDILFFDDKIIEEPDLIIPHKALAERKFVLKPLADIAPDFIHPIFKTTISDLLVVCTDNSSINLFEGKLMNPL